MLIYPNPVLDAIIQQEILNTIKTLQLNTDDQLVNERVEYVDNHKKGHISFQYLKKQAPFIAFEMERQGISMQ